MCALHATPYACASDASDDALATAVDETEARARALVEAMEAADWDPRVATRLHDAPEVQQVLRFAAEQVVPRLAGTTGELDAVLHALSGGFVPAGPSGHVELFPA